MWSGCFLVRYYQWKTNQVGPQFWMGYFCWSSHGWHYHMDLQLVRKIANRYFFQDIHNSFQWATGIGLEPRQIFFRKKIPTNTVPRAIQNFGRNGPLLAGWLSNSKNFVVNLAQTCDEQMLKISRRYLDSYLNNCKITDFIIWL